jgi:hypothetical protein
LLHRAFHILAQYYFCTKGNKCGLKGEKQLRR